MKTINFVYKNNSIGFTLIHDAIYVDAVSMSVLFQHANFEKWHELGTTQKLIYDFEFSEREPREAIVRMPDSETIWLHSIVALAYAYYLDSDFYVWLYSYCLGSQVYIHMQFAKDREDVKGNEEEPKISCEIESDFSPLRDEDASKGFESVKRVEDED